MKFEPAEKLSVQRILSDGTKVSVGTLAQNSSGCYLQYTESYLNEQQDLSPLKLAFDPSVQKAPTQPHNGLHGVFAYALRGGRNFSMKLREAQTAVGLCTTTVRLNGI